MDMANIEKVVVIDNGSGFTKMGWAGVPEPSFDIPTIIADYAVKQNVQVSKMHYDQLDFFIGKEAMTKHQTHNVIQPIKQGIIEEWSLMEKFWHRSIFDYMRCEPEECSFILTEPPMNPPENREQMAEIMFETFNVKDLYIGVQAVLALYSNYMSPTNEGQRQFGLTGTVLDSGDGITHVIPISDGYVIGSCIKHIPLAGKDITKMIVDFLKERGEQIPTQDLNRVATEIKEKYSYMCDGDLTATTQDGQKLTAKFKKHTFESVVDKKSYTVDVGYERFLGPEMFFHPEFIDSKYRFSIDQYIDNAISGSPIDCRRSLYGNIVLSGGSTLFENFPQRLQRDLQSRINVKLDMSFQRSGIQPKPIIVNVAQNPFQRFAVWQGGSMLGSQPEFYKMCHSRKDYMERGPSIARHNPVFLQGM